MRLRSFALPTLSVLGTLAMARLALPADTLFVSGAGSVYKVDLATGASTEVIYGHPNVEDGACNPTNGLIYFSEANSDRLSRWEQDGSGGTLVIPAAGSVAGPEGLSFDDFGNLYFNTRRRGSGPHAGAWRVDAADPTSTAVQIVQPFSDYGEGSDIVLTGPHRGALLLVARSERQIFISEPPGAPPQLFIDAGVFPTGYTRLIGVSTNGCGEVFVAFTTDGGNPGNDQGLIYRFDSQGNFVDIYASGLASAFFTEIDSAGNLYVTDLNNEAVWKIRPNKTRSQIAVAVRQPLGLAICRDQRLPTCPSLIHCDAGNSYEIECQGSPTCFTVDGSASTGGGLSQLNYAWSTNCPGGSFTQPQGVTSTLCLHPGSCPTSCRVQLTVSAGSTAATCKADVSVNDTTGPALQGVPGAETVECDNVPQPPTLSAGDACDLHPTIAYDEVTAPGSCPDSFTLTRTWTATDSCGASTTASQAVTVVDTGIPMLQGVPADTTVSCDSIPAAPTVTAADTCDPDPVVSFTETQTPGNCSDNYTITRTWNTADRCGNSVSATQTIHVVDTTAPTLSGVPASTTVECDNIPAAPTVTASDTCDASPVVSFTETQTPGTCPDSYTITRTWTATDRCENAVSGSQTITVIDTARPALAGVPANVTVQCDAVPAVPTVTASDTCDASPMVSFAETQTPGSCLDTYTITRIWTATDRCDNSSSATQTITVIDTSKPTLSGVPADVTVQCDAVPAVPTVTASDTCDLQPVIVFAEQRSNGNCPDSYTLTRTWTATDRCNNSISMSQTITVIDTSAPTLAGVPSDVTVECDSVPAPAQPTASDTCDLQPVIVFAEQRSNGNCPENYALRRTWTATDRCGNATSQTQVLTVHDTVSPMPTAILMPLPPLPATGPKRPASAHSVCSAPASRSFIVQCSASDNCDPNPQTSAVIVVTNHDVPSTNGTCVVREDRINVLCGDTIQIRLVAPPCPAKGPKSPSVPTSPSSAGLIVTGEQVVLEVTATDRCGNAATDVDDPTAEPDLTCAEKLADGTCCPAIAQPVGPECKKPCGPNFKRPRVSPPTQSLPQNRGRTRPSGRSGPPSGGPG